MPAKAVGQSVYLSLKDRHRRQARSHSWTAFWRLLPVALSSKHRPIDLKCPQKCGSWLACESGGSVGISGTERPHSRASPLPHLNCVPGWDLAFTAGGFMVEAPPNRFEMPSKMWELACLRKRWISLHIGHCKTAIAGKPAPTVGPRSGGYCRWLYRLMHRSVNLKCCEKMWERACPRKRRVSRYILH